jgi:hypothetical protein
LFEEGLEWDPRSGGEGRSDSIIRIVYEKQHRMALADPPVSAGEVQPSGVSRAVSIVKT